jgi:hypothetical protein
MKTYQITLDDDSAQLVDRMLQDGPWADVNELFLNGLGTLQEDIAHEDGMDLDEIKGKLHDGLDALGAENDGLDSECLEELLMNLEGVGRLEAVS